MLLADDCWTFVNELQFTRYRKQKNLPIAQYPREIFCKLKKHKEVQHSLNDARR
jgi:hypothetical protein